MAERFTPFTETPNELTVDLDIATPLEMARLFRQADEQMFVGWRGYPCLTDAAVIEECARLAIEAAEVLKAGEKGAILLSGAGTSGRLAQLLSRQFNRLLRNAHQPEVFRPLIAGGALALVKAQEGAEDDPITAANDLENVLPDDVERVLYFGITCGLSAPYTAGQLDYLRTKTYATSVMLGFNTRESVRDVPVEGWDKTLEQVVGECEADSAGRFVLLNPIYGPEAVMGSTRMKGGSATKIILETIFYVAFELCGAISADEGAKKLDPADLEAVTRRVRLLVRRYRETKHAVYESVGVLGEMIKAGGTTLRCGGHVSYLGRDSAGIVGLIDASECPPTFGATYEDIRGYLLGGWGELLDDTRDLSQSGPEYRISLENFEKEKIPELQKGDLVLGVAIGELGPKTRAVLEAAGKSKATTGVVLITAVPPKPGDLPGDLHQVHVIQIPALGFSPGFLNLAEFALKLALNALTTGAHIMVGKVYENRMIDLRISNNKLYFRSQRIMQLLSGCTKEQAKLALHRSVYKKDVLSPDERDAPPSAIIQAATNSPRIVPTALLLAMGDMTYEQATELLAADPVPRRVIKSQLEKASEATT